jgi:hypothetical protein
MPSRTLTCKSNSFSSNDDMMDLLGSFHIEQYNGKMVDLEFDLGFVICFLSDIGQVIGFPISDIFISWS